MVRYVILILFECREYIVAIFAQSENECPRIQTSSKDFICHSVLFLAHVRKTPSVIECQATTSGLPASSVKPGYLENLEEPLF